MSTVGHEGVAVDWNMAATSLEGSDACHLEVDTGQGYQVIATLVNGEDNGVFRSGTVNLGPGADDNPNLRVRFRAAGGNVGDYCYAEDITVRDGAGGGGARVVLTHDELVDGPELGAPVDGIAGFAMPEGADPPLHVFEGRLELHGEAAGGNFVKIKDTYNYDADPERLHLPEIDHAFVQSGHALIPAQRGNTDSDHPYWTYLFEPGRVWSEPEDAGMSRASLPFALLQRNSNCTHNGLMTFLFDDAGVSNVHYQITSETCLYFQGDFWGLLDASYHAEPVPGAAGLVAAHADELAARFPSRPVEELAIDYPGFDVSTLTSGISPAHMSAYGLVVDGVNYVGGCGTRTGAYPYCDVMRLPSYSTAKTLFASVAEMRIAQKHDASFGQTLVEDYVVETAASAGDWSGVTLEHALDMATGNYRFATYMTDEGSAQAETEFFLAESHADKIAGALSWQHKAAPGSTWVYQTWNTYIAGRAMDQYLKVVEGPDADVFEFLVDEVLVPADVGVGAHSTLRTSDNGWSGQAFGGYGLWLIPDDIAKLTTLLNVDDGVVNGEQLLHAPTLAAAMQRDPGDRGLLTSYESFPLHYNNGVWGRPFTAQDGFECDFWVPYMLGYGGIVVTMMPNGATYWYVSDNDEFAWVDVLAEVDEHVGSHCVGQPPPPPAGSMHVAGIDVVVVPAGGPRYRAQATVTVVDETDSPVAGVTVDATYSGSTSSSPSGTTDANGQVTLLSGKKKWGGSWTLCVDDLTLGGWSHDAGADVETCDGTSGP